MTWKLWLIFVRNCVKITAEITAAPLQLDFPSTHRWGDSHWWWSHHPVPFVCGQEECRWAASMDWEDEESTAVEVVQEDRDRLKPYLIRYSRAPFPFTDAWICNAGSTEWSWQELFLLGLCSLLAVGARRAGHSFHRSCLQTTLVTLASMGSKPLTAKAIYNTVCVLYISTFLSNVREARHNIQGAFRTKQSGDDKPKTVIERVQCQYIYKLLFHVLHFAIVTSAMLDIDRLLAFVIIHAKFTCILLGALASQLWVSTASKVTKKRVL